MSLVDFLYSLRSALDWFIHSKFVFAVIVFVSGFIFLWFLLSNLWCFIRNRYIFSRYRGRDL